MSPENTYRTKHILLPLAFTMLVGLALSACNGIDMPDKTDYVTMNGIPIVNRMNPETRVDVGVLTNFLSRYAQTVTSQGCVLPTAEQPLRFETGDHHGNPYVSNASPVIFMPEGRYLEMIGVFAHEFHHTAFCSSREVDTLLFGWTDPNRNFVFDGNNISVLNQNGFRLSISVNGEEFPIKAVEEMVATIFLRNEIAQFKNEQEGIQNGYGNKPAYYRPLFDQTLTFLNTKANGMITEDEMYSAMDKAVAEGTGKPDGFTIFSDKLSTLISEKNFDPGDDFKQQLIKTLYIWQTTDPSQSSSQSEGINMVTNTRSNFPAKEWMLLRMVGNGNRDELTDWYYQKLRRAPNRRLREKAYRDLLEYLDNRKE